MLKLYKCTIQTTLLQGIPGETGKSKDGPRGKPGKKGDTGDLNAASKQWIWSIMVNTTKGNKVLYTK